MEATYPPDKVERRGELGKTDGKTDEIISGPRELEVFAVMETFDTFSDGLQGPSGLPAPTSFLLPEFQDFLSPLGIDQVGVDRFRHPGSFGQAVVGTNSQEVGYIQVGVVAVNLDFRGSARQVALEGGDLDGRAIG
jgi:hypothetical protein